MLVYRTYYEVSLSTSTIVLNETLNTIHNAVKEIDIIVLGDIINAVKKINTLILNESFHAVKMIQEIDTIALIKSLNAVKHIALDNDINVEEQFRKCFISYAKAINKQEARRGSLFQKHFKRIHVDNDIYLMALIH